MIVISEMNAVVKRRHQRCVLLFLACLLGAFFIWRFHRTPAPSSTPTFATESHEVVPQPAASATYMLVTARTSSGCAPETFLVVVFSKKDASRRRRAIRATWGAARNSHTRYLRSRPHLFSLKFALPGGGPEVEQEVRSFGDLLVLPGSRSQQFTALLKWFSGNATTGLPCPPAFLLKTEDSTFVNMPAFSHWLAAKFAFASRQPILLGHVAHGIEPERDRRNPNYVSFEDYPKALFPDHPIGPVMLLSRTAAAAVAHVAPQVKGLQELGPFLGVAALRAGLTPEHNEHFVALGALGDPCHPLRLFFTAGANAERHLEMFAFSEKSSNIERCAQRFPHQQRDL